MSPRTYVIPMCATVSRKTLQVTSIEYAEATEAEFKRYITSMTGLRFPDQRKTRDDMIEFVLKDHTNEEDVSCITA